jgi:hypothetical protein
VKASLRRFFQPRPCLRLALGGGRCGLCAAFADVTVPMSESGNFTLLSWRAAVGWRSCGVARGLAQPLAASRHPCGMRRRGRGD